MRPELKKLLDYLMTAINPRRQSDIETLYQKTLGWKPVDRLPVVMNYPIPKDFLFPPYPHSEIFDNPEIMLYNELVSAFDAGIACRGLLDDDLPCTIRPNFGTGIIASLFGARIERHGDNPPWVRPLANVDEFREAMNRDPLDFSQGWCPRVIERYKFYHQVFADYPDLSRVIRIVLPDLEGPFSTVEMLRGSAIYVDLYDNPDLINQAMTTAAKAQVGFARHLRPLLTDGPQGYSHQHGWMILGQILNRIDSAIMISPVMYRRQVAPHDAYVLHELGGGGVHSCGRIEQIVPDIFNLPDIRCFDFGNSEMNNMTAIYSQAREKKIALVGIRASENELVTGEIMRKYPTGVCLFHQAGSLEQAKKIMDAYKKY
jgi:hypothetical protein